MSESIADLIARQRRYFESGATRPVAFRIQQLKHLARAVETFETQILEALEQDLGKRVADGAWVSEIGTVLQEIRRFRCRLKGWNKPQRQCTSLLNNGPFSQSLVERVPYGEVLIIGPWNYPFNLVIQPLVAAIGGGNTAILKPSELAPKTAGVMRELITATFAADYVTVVEGGKETVDELLGHRHDFIFFTGGNAVGRIIAAKAVHHETPYILELGGKSPVIVDPDAGFSEADWEQTAKRIAQGKFMNAGQSCIAPDYVLVPRAFKARLLERIRFYVREFYNGDPQRFGRIINTKHFERLVACLPEAQRAEKMRQRDQRYFEPVILEDVRDGDAVMQDEIFGPILAVVDCESLTDAFEFIRRRHPRPLTAYLFTNNAESISKFRNQVQAGSLVVNDTMMHFLTGLPFGSVGQAAYHGRSGFEAVTQPRAFLHKSFLPRLSDSKLFGRYPSASSGNRVSPPMRMLLGGISHWWRKK